MKLGLMTTSLVVACALFAVAGRGRPEGAGQAMGTRQAELERIRDSGDVGGMRAHGWALLEAVTATDASGLPQWQRWEEKKAVLGRATDNMFGSEGDSGPAEASLRTARDRDGRTILVRRPAPALSIYFNGDAVEHVRRNDLAAAKTFANLKRNLDSSGIATEGRVVTQFPSETITVKAMWRIVPAVAAPGEVWALPVWDEEPQRNAKMAYPPKNWDRSVAIDLTGREVAPDATTTINLPKQPKVVRVVSINRFYHLTLDAKQAAAMNATPGDQAVLVGLHVATKELPTWVWSTYWWHDRADVGKYAAGRPDEVSRSVWGNYLLDIDFGDSANARDEASRRPIFNPWLEAGLKRGIASNCLSCHQQASLTEDLRMAPFPVRLKPVSNGDATFKNRIRTDFVWSLADAPGLP